MIKLRKTLWITAAVILIIATMYGSWLVSKERDKAFAATLDNNEILTLINRQIVSETRSTKQMMGHYQVLLEAQQKTLDQSDRIMKSLEASMLQNTRILENQTKIMQDLQKIVLGNRHILEEHTKALETSLKKP